jgi:hypothetical protein
MSNWYAVAPGASLDVTLDLTQCVNLNHVSNISFKLATEADQIDATVHSQPVVVSTRSTTWGAVKALYR